MLTMTHRVSQFKMHQCSAIIRFFFALSFDEILSYAFQEHVSLAQTREKHKNIKFDSMNYKCHIEDAFCQHHPSRPPSNAILST